ncbi:Conjugal transfer protein [Vibrio crassostreae]|uniref:TrbG/VirB9 family P-type conjugative transfer protein n=1 Tax=Vibrio crassostreae TaxID=246167 RepID=UPI00104556A1|nr:TrbG/VirB9 family P-type conjugative transfer protein [Vibrio crassostreae]TCT94360.1 conjugative transfer protein CagX [Vibrio crassostreae]CAK2973528.1 Conjugal transfer protein [Vibrio crassostreae]CAK3026604.1 Conjugal transfer protein [Vibrio crassostreae]CAK3038245.1 Conjugal transfer protein [Vibrio crassostreae]CAK3720098.1 Conjugal transfer protein [Vibrio crassostreae]
MKFCHWVACLSGLFSVGVMAKACQPLPHQSGEIITVKAARYLGARVQLPANLISPPTTSNAFLWDVTGIVGTNQLLIKPNSAVKEGASTNIYAFTDDGQVIDIQASRVPANKNQTCVLVKTRGFMDAQTKQAVSSFVQTQKLATTPSVAPQALATIERLKLELKTVNTHRKEEKNRAIIEALRKYRYRIYTRYQWDEGDGFIGQNVVSDAYDDGQFTYIRLANPNRGILSIETQIGGKAAIAPMKYDDAYGMYKITGIYPRLRLHLDDVTVEVKRTDFVTRGKG